MNTTTSTAMSTHTPCFSVGLKASKVVSSASPSGDGRRGSSAIAGRPEELVVDAAQRGHVRSVTQPRAELRVFPGIPGRADQLAADAVRLVRQQERGEL